MERLPNRASDSGPDAPCEAAPPRDYYEALCEVKEACRDILRYTANSVLLPAAKRRMVADEIERIKAMTATAETMLRDAGYLPRAHGMCAGCGQVVLWSQSHTTAPSGDPLSPEHWHTQCWNERRALDEAAEELYAE